jgi:hypothetical protein
MANPKHPPGPPMTLANMYEQGDSGAGEADARRRDDKFSML